MGTYILNSYQNADCFLPFIHKLNRILGNLTRVWVLVCYIISPAALTFPDGPPRFWYSSFKLLLAWEHCYILNGLRSWKILVKLVLGFKKVKRVHFRKATIQKSLLTLTSTKKHIGFAKTLNRIVNIICSCQILFDVSKLSSDYLKWCYTFLCRVFWDSCSSITTARLLPDRFNVAPSGNSELSDVFHLSDFLCKLLWVSELSSKSFSLGHPRRFPKISERKRKFPIIIMAAPVQSISLINLVVFKRFFIFKTVTINRF